MDKMSGSTPRVQRWRAIKIITSCSEDTRLVSVLISQTLLNVAVCFLAEFSFKISDVESELQHRRAMDHFLH
ncbi:hypothetical protein JOB18_004379 [Solea senegalensis]|uniref:Uncharacterized protein n=1 Tax=Solea senegalensis TaxID=28829 RepID=A0AAV6S8M6_SOLSE|nr:hypothetical protein JOB18_004379 [Solea senegalensis]